MSYLVRKRMKMDGKDYAPGDIVPYTVIESIRPGRLGSMVRLRHLEEVLPSQAVAAHQPMNDTQEEGDICPHCGGGPYKGLTGHITKMHKAQEE